MLCATLFIFYEKMKDNSPAGHELKLYRALGDWYEGTLTWNTQPSYDPVMTSSAIIPGSPGVWMEWDVTDDVFDFLAGSEENYGWKFTDEHYWGGANIPIAFFTSKEGVDNHPYLEIQYAED